MKDLLSKISPGIFGIIVFCFFLPFVTISCQNQEIMKISGIQLITGVKIKQPSMNLFDTQPKTEMKDIKPDVRAIIAFLSAILGLIISLFYLRNKIPILPVICGILAALGFFMLLLFKISADNQIIKEGEGIIQLKYNIGFWLSLILFLINGIINFYIYILNKKEVYTKGENL